MDIDLEWALCRLFPGQYLLIYRRDHDPKGTRIPQLQALSACAYNSRTKQTKQTVLILIENSDVTAAKIQL